MNIQTFPEINSLNLKQVRAALALAIRNYGALKPEAQAELALRMKALVDRKRRLEATGKHIARVNRALRSNR